MSLFLKLVFAQSLKQKLIKIVKNTINLSIHLVSMEVNQILTSFMHLELFKSLLIEII